MKRGKKEPEARSLSSGVARRGCGRILIEASCRGARSVCCPPAELTSEKLLPLLRRLMPPHAHSLSRLLLPPQAAAPLRAVVRLYGCYSIVISRNVQMVHCDSAIWQALHDESTNIREEPALLRHTSSICSYATVYTPYITFLYARPLSLTLPPPPLSPSLSFSTLTYQNKREI